MSGNKKMGLMDEDGVKAIIESYVVNGEQDSLEMLQNMDSGLLTAKQWKNAFKKFKYEDDEEINYRLTDALFVVVDNSPEKAENLIPEELVSKFKEGVSEIIIEDISKCDGRMAAHCADRVLLKGEDWEVVFKNLHYKAGMRNHSYNNDLTAALAVATKGGKYKDMLHSMHENLRDRFKAELLKFSPGAHQ